MTVLLRVRPGRLSGWDRSGRDADGGTGAQGAAALMQHLSMALVVDGLSLALEGSETEEKREEEGGGRKGKTRLLSHD